MTLRLVLRYVALCLVFFWLPLAYLIARFA
jgi:hypothetical protein